MGTREGRELEKRVCFSDTQARAHTHTVDRQGQTALEMCVPGSRISVKVKISGRYSLIVAST